MGLGVKRVLAMRMKSVSQGLKPRFAVGVGRLGEMAYRP